MKSLKEATEVMNEADKCHEASKDNHTQLEYLNEFLAKQIKRKEPAQEAMQLKILCIQHMKDTIEESHSKYISEEETSFKKKVTMNQ